MLKSQTDGSMRRDLGGFAGAVVVFLLSFVLALVSIWLSREPGSIASLWLPNGAVIAFCVNAVPRRQPALILVACLAYAMANLTYDSSLLNAVIFLPGNAIEITLGTYLLGRKNLSTHFSNSSRLFLLTLALGVLIPTLLGSAIGAALIDLAGYATFAQTWLDWFISVALGSATTLPLTLNIKSGSSLKEAKSPLFWLIQAAVGVSTFVCLIYFPYPFGLLSVMLLSVAFSRSRLTCFVAAPLVVLVFGLTTASGLWSTTTEDTPMGHAVMYLTLLFVVIPPQVVAVLIARKHALEETLTAIGGQSGQLAEFIDMQGQLRWANKARENYLGIPNEQCIGSLWEPSAQLAAAPLVTTAIRGTACEDTVTTRYPDKGVRTMVIRAETAYDQEGQQTGVLLTSTDITEVEASRRKLQELAKNLELANQDLKQFLRVSSHDLLEPLNTIRQFASLMEQHDPQADWPSTLEYLSFMQSAAARMGATLDDIRTYIQIDEAVCRNRFELMDVNVIVEQLLQHIRPEIERAGAEVSLNLSGTVSADRDHLLLAIRNLLSNALKFVLPGTKPVVHITSYRRGSFFVIEVADNGIGIPQDKLEILGEPFKRLHARRRYDGTGLGLAICKRIVDKHDGQLQMSSIPDRGSRFAIVLPCR